MGAFLGVLPLVLQRLRANARLQAAVLVGAVLATALMSTTSIYTGALRDLGLKHALKVAGPDKLNILILSSSQSSNRTNFERDQGVIVSTSGQYLGRLLEGEASVFARSATFFPTAPGQPVASEDTRPRAHLQFLSQFESKVRLVEGKLPGYSTGVPGVGPQIEVALSATTARRLGIKTGDRFDLHPFWALTGTPVRATLVGLVEPIDLRDPFWRGQRDIFDVPPGNWETMPFFIAQNTYFDAVATYLPSMVSDYWNVFYADAGRINNSNAKTYASIVTLLDQQLASSLPRISFTTELGVVLNTYDEKLFFTRIPLLVLILQISGIVLYYLYMVSTMLVERQAAEIALFKSRGATTSQVMRVYVIEGFFVFFGSFLVGPLLAAVMISLLGYAPPFHDLSGGSALNVSLSPSAYLWAALGAGLAFATLLWPAYQACRRTMVQQRTASARPPLQAALTRYFIDFVMVGFGAFLFYQLDRRGSVVTEKLFGERSTDPLLLLTPAVFILTVGVIFLRVFPFVLQLLAWIVARVQGVAVLIGMWQMVRNPVHYSRLILLLMLATAVGMFSASFGSTLKQSYVDRAAFEAGADMRLTHLRRLDADGPRTMQAEVTKSLEAQIVSPALRLSGSAGSAFEPIRFDVLGIDPATFASVSYFRDDFASASLGALVMRIQSQPTEQAVAAEIPAGVRYLGLWVNPQNPAGRTAFDLQLEDAFGRIFSVTLGPRDGFNLDRGWSFIAADLSNVQVRQGSVQFRNAPPAYPLRVLSLSLRFATRTSALSGAIQVGDLLGSDQAGALTGMPADLLLANPARDRSPMAGGRTIVDFSARSWQAIEGLSPQKMTDDLVDAGAGDVLFTWRQVAGSPNRGLSPRIDLFGELPVLASAAFLRDARMKVGDSIIAYLDGYFGKVRIVGSFDLMPTLQQPDERPALVADVNRLVALRNLMPRGLSMYPDELWLKADATVISRTQAKLATGEIQATPVVFSELRNTQQRDPLVAAGWEGVLFISFGAVLLLSALGFLIYSYLTAQRRSLEFAVLRTMGFSRRQIGAVVGFEQLFVLALGVITGTAMGLRLGSLMIRYMGLTETGDQALPPMALHVDWLTISGTWLILGAAFLVTIGIVVLLYSRLALHRVLRIGEA